MEINLQYLFLKSKENCSIFYSLLLLFFPIEQQLNIFYNSFPNKAVHYLFMTTKRYPSTDVYFYLFNNLKIAQFIEAR